MVAHGDRFARGGWQSPRGEDLAQQQEKRRKKVEEKKEREERRRRKKEKRRKRVVRHVGWRKKEKITKPKPNWSDTFKIGPGPLPPTSKFLHFTLISTF